MKKETFFNAIKNKKTYFISGLFIFVLAFLLTAVSVGKVFADDETTPSTITDTTTVIPDTSTTATTTTDPLASLNTSTTATDITTIVGSITTEPVATETTAPATPVAPEEPAVVPVIVAPVVSPALSTEEADYNPGETATIFGSFFQSLQTVVLRIFGNSEIGNHYTDTSRTITTDNAGDFSYAYLLDNMYRPFYTVVASTLTGEEIASTTFTDAAGASIDEYSQCANGTGTGPTCNWTNGDLNGSNSVYTEEDSTVQRLAITGLSNGAHTVVIEYQTTKGGKHAYDFLTNDTASESWVTTADICSSPVDGALPSCTSLTPNLSPSIPHDPLNVSGTPDTNQHFKIRNGTITSFGTPTLVSGSYGADSATDIAVNFTVNTSTCADVSGGKCPVLITWGAHVSSQADWGAGSSAVNINGSPYHVKVVELDGGSTGNRDNQMSASAIIAGSTITVHKVTSNQDTTTQFNFTTTGTGYSNFALTGGTQNQQNITGTGSFSVTEAALAGWSNTALTCTATGTGSSATPNLANRSVAITIGSAGGAVIDCIYTNTLQQAHLTLVKTVTKDNGGTAIPTDWTLSASGATPISGATGSAAVTNAAVNSGTYTLSENGGPAGYTGGTYSCVKNAGAPVSANSVTLAAGDNATCTINNNDNAPSLTLNKIVINDNGGAAAESAWTLTANGGAAGTLSGPGAAGSTDVQSGATFKAGTYALSESAGPSGYTPSSWSCVKNAAAPVTGASITLGLGDTATCTITNDDNAAHLIVIKHVVNDNGGTKIASDFTMTIGGVTATGGNSFAGAEAPGTNKTLSTLGAYTVTEGAVTGYTQTSASADCSGTIALGETKTCTITNDDNAAHLIVIKTVINDNGGSKVAGDFSGTISGVTALGGNTWTGTVTPGMDKTLSTIGAYGVAENADAGYDTTYSADCTGTIALGQTKTCTVTNNDKPAHLIVIKHVINDNGGTAVASGFSTTISGVTTATPTAAGAEAPGINNTLTTVGSYSVDEGAHTGYDKTLSADCSGTIALGETKTCTITNDDQAAHLIVIKHVVNDNGGTKTSSDFTMTIGGVTATGGNSFAGAENPGTNKTLSTLGAYAVTEGAVTGYTQTGTSTDCSGTIALGETKTCTITNDDVQPKLTLTKIVVNDNGGNAVVADFPLFANATGVTSGVQNGFDAGSYTASETNMTGYTAGSWTGDCAADGSVSLLPGDVKACTITNDDQPAHIILNKVVVNNNGGTAGINDFGLTVGGNAVTSGTNSLVNSNVAIVLNEAGLTGYDFVSLTGDAKCPSVLGGSVTLNEGETVNCTITNDDQAAHLIVIKHVINDNGGTAVASGFSTTISGVTTATPTAAGAEAPGINNTLTTVGSYSVDEGAHTGYDKTLSADCSGTIALGETKTCTITNDDQIAHLIVIKHVINHGGSKVAGDFTMNVTGTNVSSPSFAGAENPGTTVTLNAGSYSADETLNSNYTKTISADCSGTIALGETKTCTITNEEKTAKLTIVKVADPKDLIDFSFNGTGGIGAFSLDDDAGVSGEDNALSNTAIFTNKNTGSYTVTETEPNSFWTLSSASCVNTAGSAPYSSSLSGTALTVNLTPGSDVTCTFHNHKDSPTRTQGFWQTHTAFTSTKFTAGFPAGMQIGSGLHKGIITNTQSNGQSQLFGAYYSNIAKTTTNTQRTAVDKARMQLLQQLVTAKLNCATFTCSATIAGQIAAADTAYATGTAAQIIAAAGQMDAYNNSGDTLIVGNAGSASPKTSQGFANMVFWNLP